MVLNLKYDLGMFVYIVDEHKVKKVKITSIKVELFDIDNKQFIFYGFDVDDFLYWKLEKYVYPTRKEAKLHLFDKEDW